mgnify:FL=1
MSRFGLLMLVLLSGCQTADLADSRHAGAHDAAAGPVPHAVRVRALAKADWSRMESLSFELRDYGVSPRELRLKAGQPYKLTISNSGSVSHYFNAPEFLHSIAARKAEVPHQAEIKADFFTSFEISRRGGSMDLYFIPVVAGVYRAHCHLEGKEHEGVVGTLIVE